MSKARITNAKTVLGWLLHRVAFTESERRIVEEAMKILDMPAVLATVEKGAK